MNSKSDLATLVLSSSSSLPLTRMSIGRRGLRGGAGERG